MWNLSYVSSLLLLNKYMALFIIFIVMLIKSLEQIVHVIIC